MTGLTASSMLVSEKSSPDTNLVRSRATSSSFAKSGGVEDLISREGRADSPHHHNNSAKPAGSV